MRDLIKSMVRLSVAMPALAAKQAVDLWSKPGDSRSLADDFTKVSDAMEAQLDDATKGVFERGIRMESDVLGLDARETTRATVAVEPAEPSGLPKAVHSGDLDTRTIVVLGEGLAAGFGDFTLAAEFQRESFGAHLGAQMGRDFTQPLIESPGLGNAPGFPSLPVVVPALMQTSALNEFPPARPPHNLSVPGFRVADASRLRPVSPIVHQDDARQTLANLILGLPELIQGAEKLPTQLERAIAHEPTFALVELGFHEVLEAAVAGRPGDLPDRTTFGKDYEEIVLGLGKGGASLLLLTIPDPIDTAYFSSVESAAKNLKVTPALLMDAFGLASDDLIPVPALVEMGFQFLGDTVGTVAVDGIMKKAVSAQVSEAVRSLNDEIRALAEKHKAEVFDLAALLHRIAEHGVAVGPRTLTADFLGGFYLLNGYYPGATGHAVIANAIIEQLNQAHGATFRPVDLTRVIQGDSAADCRPAGGPVRTGEHARASTMGVTDAVNRLVGAPAGTKRPVKKGAKADAKATAKPASGRLKLPPGLEQTLAISKASSYFGDAIRVANCRQESERTFGSGRESLFGGLAMVDSHLSGELKIRFSEPVGDLAHFEVRHGRLEGEDGTLASPLFFKLPVRHNEVRDDDDLVSSGDLDLNTGEVSNLKWAVRFGNTSLMALLRVNPKLPNLPIEFPGLYGSAWARFQQREDGLLDFSFYGSTFIPLGGAMEGDPIRFPLPLCGPTLEFASIPAPGTSLHPHLALSTREPEPVDPALVPEIPVNTVREYTIHTRNSSFGDKFTLNSPDLAGDPTGRSQLLGRVLVQFGMPSGDSVPVAITCINPGGMLAEPMPSPLADAFPGRLPPSPIGHNEFLRFATRTYYLDALTCIDDPFDLSLGNVSRSSGRLLSELLHRALIGQNLFYALLRVEPRTPKSSFFFRGPAHFEKGKDGRTVLRFAGQVNIPYPEGFIFPSPDMAKGVAVGPHSELDPFYWIQAIQHERSTDAVLAGAASKVLSSANELFSYKYEIGGDSKKTKPAFEYTNHTVDGTFVLKTLSWVSFVNSHGAAPGDGGYDTVSFAGFGTWSRDASGGLHMVCAQICEAKALPYVSIQIGGGRISNVNTKPPNLDDVRP